MNKKDAQRVFDTLTNITKHFGISRLHQSTLADTTVRGDAHKAIAIMQAEVADHAKREQALQDVVSFAIPTEKLPAPALLTTMTFAPDIGPPPVDLPIGLIEPAEASLEMVTPYISREHFDRAFPAEKPDAWQTILTAPKTGKESLFATEEFGQVVLYWDDELGWQSGFDYDQPITPTHWMPLPKGPTQ